MHVSRESNIDTFSHMLSQYNTVTDAFFSYDYSSRMQIILESKEYLPTFRLEWKAFEINTVKHYRKFCQAVHTFCSSLKMHNATDKGPK